MTKSSPSPEQAKHSDALATDSLALDAKVTQAQSDSVSPGPEDEVINDDERARFNWRSRYPKQAITRIRWEAAYVLAMFAVALAGVFLTWHGDLFGLVSPGCNTCQPSTFNRYAYLCFSGLLGGALFGLKYLYKVVARGWWNEDRELWRLYSPFLAAGLAFAVGALADAGLFGFTIREHQSGASFVSLGFIAGYFADSASRKMQEIADTLFGHPAPTPTRKSGTQPTSPPRRGDAD